MNDDAIVTTVVACSIAALGITYFIFVRSDGTVLLSLASILGGLVGYRIGRKRK